MGHSHGKVLSRTILWGYGKVWMSKGMVTTREVWVMVKFSSVQLWYSEVI